MPFKPRLSERDPGLAKHSTGLENVLTNTTGDSVDPNSTFIIFPHQLKEHTAEDGTPMLEVSRLVQEGEETIKQSALIPKQAFQKLGDAYYLPTYRYSTVSACIGGGLQGFIAGGAPGAAAGVASGLAASKVGKSAPVRAGIGMIVGAAVLTAAQVALYGSHGIPAAIFAGSMIGLVGASSGEGDAGIRDSMFGGNAAGFAAGMATGAPLSMLTGAASNAIGAQVSSRTGQVLLSAGAGGALMTAQALISGGSPALAAGIGAAVGGIGSLIGPGLSQLGRNTSKAVEPFIAKGINKALEGQGDTTYQVVAAIPESLAFASLGASIGLISPALTPLGIAVGATAGGVHGFIRAGKKIDELKELNKKRIEAVKEPIYTTPAQEVNK